MNDCPDGNVRDRLPDYVHERLSAGARAEVQAHLGACADCQAEVALLRDLRSVMRASPAIDIPAIRAGVAPYRVPVQRSWAGWKAAAAVTLLIAGGSSVMLVQHTGAGSPVGQQTVAQAPAVQQNAVPLQPQAAIPAPAAVAEVAPQRGELAVGGGTITELSDNELASLVNDINSLDALPSTDVESGAISPIGPMSGRKGEL